MPRNRLHLCVRHDLVRQDVDDEGIRQRTGHSAARAKSDIFADSRGIVVMQLGLIVIISMEID
jgi:hypothetical protein